eukprot:4005517-Pyramimonas_sp.AAC.3
MFGTVGGVLGDLPPSDRQTPRHAPACAYPPRAFLLPSVAETEAHLSVARPGHRGCGRTEGHGHRVEDEVTEGAAGESSAGRVSLLRQPRVRSGTRNNSKTKTGSFGS